MELEKFTIEEFDQNINELKEMYERFSKLEKIKWPERWILIYKNNVDYVKRKEIDKIYELNLLRYQNAKKIWFDGNGNLKPKYKNIMINFYGGILWLHNLMQSLYNNSIEDSRK